MYICDVQGIGESALQHLLVKRLYIATAQGATLKSADPVDPVDHNKLPLLLLLRLLYCHYYHDDNDDDDDDEDD